MIAKTDKRFISLMAIWPVTLISLVVTIAGCVPVSEDAYTVVSVETHPARATEHLEGTSSCTAMRIRDIPATRTFRSGRTEDYYVSQVIGLVDICK